MSTSLEILAAQAAVKAALIQLLAAYQHDGEYLTAANAQIETDESGADGSYAVGGIARDEFHHFAGGSL